MHELVRKLLEINILPHNPNNVLYKYVNAEDAIKILENQTLLYQSPSQFNDPFDMHIGLLNIQQEARDTLLEKTFGSYTKEQIEMLQKIPLDVWEKIAEEQILEEKNNTGILCLSKVMDNTLMWSHYSNKHHGVCMGFKMPIEDKNFDRLAFEINYVSTVVPRAFGISDSMDDIATFIYWACTKARIWEYEQEVRVLNIPQAGLMPFRSEQLQELYFGVATPDHHIMRIKELLKDYAPRSVGKMAINRAHFNLEIRHY